MVGPTFFLGSLSLNVNDQAICQWTSMLHTTRLFPDIQSLSMKLNRT